MKNRFFIVAVLTMLCMSGCQSKEKKEEIYNSADAIESSEWDTNSVNTVFSDDLVYKEYSLGEKFDAGEVLISKELLLSITENPESIVVYFNDEMFETFNYNDNDISVDIEKEGTYCFVIIDTNGETTDITSKIQGTSYLESKNIVY